MKHCDVLVVGGGPAGSTCARQLTRAGLDVIVLDRQPFPRDKVCAGWITPAVVEMLGLDLNDYAADRVLQPIKGFHVGRMGTAGVETRYGEAVSFGILRREFDDYLLRRCGARLDLGRGLERLEREGRHWIANDGIRAAALVGAGGHFCPVARQLGNRTGRGEAAIAAQEVEYLLPAGQGAACRVAEEVPEIYFCDDLKGYGWCVRKGDHLNIGLGREDNRDLAGHVSRFVRFLVESGRIPAEVPERFKGHAYLPYAQTPRRIVGDGVLLIGDSAGLAYPQSGEGIRPAVESALIAAGVLAEAGGDYRAAALGPYEKRIEARFGPRRADDGNGWLPSSAKQAAARMLLANRWFNRHVVMDRWFLHRHQPMLAQGGAG